MYQINMELHSLSAQNNSDSPFPVTKNDFFLTSTSSNQIPSLFQESNFADHPKKKSQKLLPSLNPFSPESKPSEIFVNSRKTSEKFSKNLNFGYKNFPFSSDLRGKKDSDDSWVHSDSKILNKFSENYSKTDKYLERFNDSDLRRNQ